MKIEGVAVETKETFFSCFFFHPPGFKWFSMSPSENKMDFLRLQNKALSLKTLFLHFILFEEGNLEF
jgi:hypothetical protein